MQRRLALQRPVPHGLSEALVPCFASLLLSLMHDDQLDDVLAANSMRSLARLLDTERGSLGKDLVPSLPFQLLAMGMRRLPALKHGPSAAFATVTFIPAWLEEFIWVVLKFGRSQNDTATGSNSDLDRVLGALAPCAPALVHSAARHAGAGKLLPAVEALNIMGCFSAELSGTERGVCAYAARPEQAGRAAAMVRAAVELAATLERSATASLLPDVRQVSSALQIRTLLKGAEYAAVACHAPSCQLSAQVEGACAAPCARNSSATVVAADTVCQQLQQAADVLTIGTGAASAVLHDMLVEDPPCSALQALIVLRDSGAVLTAATAAASFAVPAAAAQVAGAAPEPAPGATAAALPDIGALGGSAESSATPCSRQAQAADRLESVATTQLRSSATAGGATCRLSPLALTEAHSKFLSAAGCAVCRTVAQPHAEIPQLVELEVLKALVDLISDASGNSCGWCGGRSPSHFLARLRAPAWTLEWLWAARDDDLPEVCCLTPVPSRRGYGSTGSPALVMKAHRTALIVTALSPHRTYAQRGLDRLGGTSSFVRFLHLGFLSVCQPVITACAASWISADDKQLTGFASMKLACQGLLCCTVSLAVLCCTSAQGQRARIWPP